MDPTTRTLTSLCIAALLSTGCKATPTEPDEAPTEQSSALHNAICHIQPGVLTAEGLGGLGHLDQVEEMLHLSGVPAVTITPEGAALDHVPIRLSELAAALTARGERLAEGTQRRSELYAKALARIQALTVDSSGLTLGLVDTTETNVFFKGLPGTLPEGAELVADDQGYLTLVHQDRAVLESFFMGKVDPTHEVALEQVVSPWGEVWRSHYLYKGVGLSKAVFNAFAVEGSAHKEWVHMTFSLTEPEPFYELTQDNVGRRVVFMSGGDVAAHATVEEALTGGAALARFDMPGASGQLMAETPAPSPAPAFRVFLDSHLTLDQVRERLGVVAAAGSGAIALRMARPVAATFAEMNPESAKLVPEGAEGRGAPGTPKYPLADEVSDACPELVEAGESLASAFPSEREELADGFMKAWAGCGCRGEESISGLILETRSARLDRTFFVLAEVGEATGEVRTFGGETTWGEALEQLEPGACVRVLPDEAGPAGFMCAPSKE